MGLDPSRPIDLSITKAVAYLMLGTLSAIALGLFTMRTLPCPASGKRSERRCTSSRRRRSRRGCRRRRSAVAFVLRDAAALHLHGQPARLHPAAAHRRDVARRAHVGIYAATSSLSVTLGLALLTFFFTHWASGGTGRGAISRAGSRGAKGLLILIIPLEILGQFMRLISLSATLREHARGPHPDPRPFLGLIFIFESLALVFTGRPRRSSTSSKSSSSSGSRHSSSLLCPPSTSARRWSRSGWKPKCSLSSPRDVRQCHECRQGDRPRPRSRARRGRAGVGIGINDPVRRSPPQRAAGHPVARLRPDRGRGVLRCFGSILAYVLVK